MATHTIIFVNSKNFADVLHKILRGAGKKAAIIFGHMSNEEREEMIDKFRNGEISVIITTNMLARGIDVPQVQVVINFDVPTRKDGGAIVGDAETYLHRIGRAGRFGVDGIAISIYDRDCDKTYLD